MPSSSTLPIPLAKSSQVGLSSSTAQLDQSVSRYQLCRGEYCGVGLRLFTSWEMTRRGQSSSSCPYSVAQSDRKGSRRSAVGGGTSSRRAWHYAFGYHTRLSVHLSPGTQPAPQSQGDGKIVFGAQGANRLSNRKPSLDQVTS